MSHTNVTTRDNNEVDGENISLHYCIVIVNNKAIFQRRFITATQIWPNNSEKTSAASIISITYTFTSFINQTHCKHVRRKTHRNLQAIFPLRSMDIVIVCTHITDPGNKTEPTVLSIVAPRYSQCWNQCLKDIILSLLPKHSLTYYQRWREDTVLLCLLVASGLIICDKDSEYQDSFIPSSPVFHPIDGRQKIGSVQKFF